MDFEESSSCCFYKCVAKIVQGEANETCFKLVSRSLSYAKIVQGEANETCFKLVSRSLSYAKVRRLLCHIATQGKEISAISLINNLFSLILQAANKQPLWQTRIYTTLR